MSNKRKPNITVLPDSEFNGYVIYNWLNINMILQYVRRHTIMYLLNQRLKPYHDCKHQVDDESVSRAREHHYRLA